MKKIFSFLAIGVIGLALAACQNSSNKTDSADSTQIMVAADTTFPPFETSDDKGNPAGFDIDLIKAIAQKENMNIKFQSMEFKGIIPGLQSGLVQIGVAGITETPEREQVINFSNAYYLSGLTVLGKAGKETPISATDGDVNAAVAKLLQGKIVATRKGSTSVTYLEKVKGIKKVLQFDNSDDAYNAVNSGGANFVLFDNPVNLSFIHTAQKNSNMTSQYHIMTPLLTGEYYGIAVSKKYPDLLDKINDGLEKIQEDGTYQKLYEKYFGNDQSGIVSHKLTAADIFAQADKKNS